jgi:hypothetical protein
MALTAELETMVACCAEVLKNKFSSFPVDYGRIMKVLSKLTCHEDDVWSNFESNFESRVHVTPHELAVRNVVHSSDGSRRRCKAYVSERSKSSISTIKSLPRPG